MAFLNRKGVFFTLMTLVVLSIFMFSTVTYSDYLTREAVQKRVESMDNFVFSTEKNLERQIYIHGFRTIFALEANISASGHYLTNIQEVFQEAFFNGTLYGQENNLLKKTNFSEMQTKIEENSRKINMEVLLTNPKLNVSQEDPWNVVYILTVDFYARDLGNLASWNKSLVVKSKIPVEGFSDPVYFVSTNGLVPNKITKTPFSSFVSGLDIENLKNHTSNSYYVPSNSGPNFLMRLEGDLNPDANGIESLVNLEELSSQGLGTESKSAIDYIYFSSNNPPSCNVLPAGMPSWFRLDASHLATYEVSCA